MSFNTQTKLLHKAAYSLRRLLVGMRRSQHSSASLISPNPSDILAERIGSTGVITLNRPKAHNAINHYMTVTLGKQLQQWAAESSVSLVIIKGAGGKAFGAGGDVRELSETAKKDHSSPDAFKFILDEFNTQYLIGTYDKPVVALAHGYCMGGGCGVAVNSRYTIATEKTVMAMPETLIGFVPDNGGSHFLSHLRGEIGTYLGLTSLHLRGSDTYHAGLATHFINSQSLSQLESELCSQPSPTHQSVRKILDNYHKKAIEDSHPFSLLPHLDDVNRIFSENKMETIMEKLNELDTEWSRSTIKTLLKCSPTAQKVTLRMLHECKNLDLHDCLALELKAGRTILQNLDSDFFRGIQATFIDKSGIPKWLPDNLSEVTNDDVDKHFESLETFGYDDFKAKL